ncbi:sigma-70 family RNA polymerase sigma factor [Fulvivirga sp. 29W222]|uniref:Sigma-70 family RNA polymerase sigma factor n=1 Tax=Fulvivirga marina TaxID=2494733 RepID=A0A937KDU8_9BACT|nr:sigma-70 family RNA polymerase sigma factor [Fulvivirga marina]MBL6446450.1 sigma-70 family RNA polymerase sigma factor [Fulvivirga marina]
MAHLDNDQIILRLKQDDSSCLEDLVVAYKSYCVNGLKKKTKCSDEEAEDLFIDALLELRDKVLSDKLDHLLNAKSYIFGICYNKWLSAQRLKNKTIFTSIDAEGYYQQYLKDDSSLDLEDLEYKMQLLNITNRALGTIGEKCYKLIKYFYIEKRSMEDIANIMGFASADVAKTSKSRCFKKLVEKTKELEKL